jgi:hypothetical protein
MVTANTLSATIVITDTRTDRPVTMLAGEPGAHGVQSVPSLSRRMEKTCS